MKLYLKLFSLMICFLVAAAKVDSSADELPPDDARSDSKASGVNKPSAWADPILKIFGKRMMNAPFDLNGDVDAKKCTCKDVVVNKVLNFRARNKGNSGDKDMAGKRVTSPFIQDVAAKKPEETAADPRLNFPARNKALRKSLSNGIISSSQVKSKDEASKYSARASKGRDIAKVRKSRSVNVGKADGNVTTTAGTTNATTGPGTMATTTLPNTTTAPPAVPPQHFKKIIVHKQCEEDISYLSDNIEEEKHDSKQQT